MINLNKVYSTYSEMNKEWGTAHPRLKCLENNTGELVLETNKNFNKREVGNE